MSETPNLSSAWTAAFRRSLLAFFDTRHRDLPWRRTRDPYRVWISEVMLQQTRVETVIPYYERWIAQFPTIDALASADTDDVLRAWQGLGYYSRARNLQHAARLVRERHDGSLPDDAAALRGLPGIGEYTAGAIASIAWDRREPAVDGNVRRVLHRLVDAAALAPAIQQRLAARLVPADRPGDFNQAFMELGATICTPRSPRCPACPVAGMCGARKAGTQAKRPAPKKKRPVPEFDVGTAVVVAGGRVLIARRPETGLLAGLWEFPGVVVRANEATRAAARRAARSHAVLVPARTGSLLVAVPHAFSHRHETYHAWRFEIGHAVEPGPAARWIAIDAFGDYPMPKAQQRIAWMLRNDERPGDTLAGPP